MTLTIGSLFSGIGGLELGLERAGLGPVLWQCEIDPFCRRVLAKHWPTVTRFVDVTRPRDYPHVDLICGGFPCQDVSAAGRKRGLGGQKSSLWWHYAEVVRRVQPRFVVVENVTSGQKLWLPHVRHQLHMLGYRTSAFGISAADVGAPHLRRRTFVVAHSRGEQLREQPGRERGPGREGSPLAAVAGDDGAPAAANADRAQCKGDRRAIRAAKELAHARNDGDAWEARGASTWAAPPLFRGVDDGVPRRLDRLRVLGNAVVPECAEVIGRIILARWAPSAKVAV